MGRDSSPEEGEILEEGELEPDSDSNRPTAGQVLSESLSSFHYGSLATHHSAHGLKALCSVLKLASLTVTHRGKLALARPARDHIQNSTKQ